MQSYIRSLANVGTSDQLPVFENRKIKILNGIALLIIAALIAFVVLNAIVNRWSLVVIDVVGIVLLSCIFMFHKHGYYTLAQIWLSINGNIFIFLLIAAKPDIYRQTEITLFAVAVWSAIFFKGVKGYIFLAINIATYIAARLLFVEPLMDACLPTDYVSYINPICVFVVIYVIVNILKEQYLRSEQVVMQKNKELNHAFEQLKKTQSQLVHAEKMASLGTLTAGIAHEINNPINFVSGNINPLVRDIEDVQRITKLYRDGNKSEADELADTLDYDFITNEIQMLIKGIRNGAERTAQIVKNLRTFSRLDEDVLKPSNLHQNIEATLGMLNNRITPQINIVKNFDTNITDITCFAGKLNQALLNIFTNALQAIGNEGTITITTQSINDTIQIIVADTGVGMTEQVRQQAFEPFFTTRPIGQGSGLGLSIALSIIQEHNGNIELQSTPNNGTTCIITMPIETKTT